MFYTTNVVVHLPSSMTPARENTYLVDISICILFYMNERIFCKNDSVLIELLLSLIYSSMLDHYIYIKIIKC